jgi:hypothetical protein
MKSLSGFKVRGLDADTDRVSVQSSAQPTHLLTRRRWPLLPAKWTTIEISRDELIVLKCNHGAASIELKHLGGPHGDLVIDDNGQFTRLREGSVMRLHLNRDRAVFVKTQAYQVPRHAGQRFVA